MILSEKVSLKLKAQERSFSNKMKSFEKCPGRYMVSLEIKTFVSLQTRRLTLKQDCSDIKAESWML